MSVAALQKQLAATNVEDVKLRPYFTTLCESIAASMIRDHSQLSLDVTVDDNATSADASVSLGLIVTELVINALKHAFRDERNGKITRCTQDRNAERADQNDVAGRRAVALPKCDRPGQDRNRQHNCHRRMGQPELFQISKTAPSRRHFPLYGRVKALMFKA